MVSTQSRCERLARLGLRAAKIAELEAVPVRVVKFTDAEAIEGHVVENLQREDIHPPEEALGFRSLLELKDATYAAKQFLRSYGPVGLAQSAAINRRSRCGSVRG